MEWADKTTLHPIGLAAVVVLGVAMLLLPRRYAILPMIIMACFIPSAQRVVVMTLDFNLLRLMVVFGWARLLLRSETTPFGWKPLDTVLILWAISATVVYTLQQSSVPALVNRLGMSFDALGMYFLFRCLVRNWEDLRQISAAFVLISIPVAIAFLLENRTGRNVFAVFGGVPAITAVREGRLRCQGAFSHPILAGCFWASLMPLMAAGMWKSLRDRIWATIGLVASGVIVVLCASSTPVVAVIMAALGVCMFPLRSNMRLVRWSLVACLAVLHFIMNNPVWHLLARIDLAGGSTGWHRFFLIDQAIRHFGEWWLLGTVSTLHWGLGLFDVTNQYVLVAVEGGLITLVLFVTIFVYAFGAVGRLWRVARPGTGQLAMAWALGVSLFVHCANFFAGSYFGSIILVWYLLLAMIASMEPIRPVTTILDRQSRKQAQRGGPGALMPNRHHLMRGTRS